MNAEIKTLYEIEQDQILKVLQYFNGNKTKTAHALGITTKTLYNRLEDYGMHVVNREAPQEFTVPVMD